MTPTTPQRRPYYDEPDDHPEYALAYGAVAILGFIIGLTLGWMVWGGG